MIPSSPFRVLVVLELTEAYAQAILRGVCRRGGQDPRLRLHTTRLFPLEALPRRLEQCDAVIASLVQPEVAEILLALDVPLVNVSNRGTSLHPYSVVSDLGGALERALLHFRERGISRVAMLGTVADTADLPPELADSFMFLGQIPFGGGQRILNKQSLAETGEWLRQAGFPLGVFCGSDAVAQQLAEICERCGISVPEEVAIVGSGNDEVACLSAHPTLSSVDLQFEEVGVRAVDMLFELLEGNTPDPPQQAVPSGTVMVRQSSNVYAVDDPYVARALIIMEEHLTSHLDIATLADQLHISRRMFEHRFQRQMKMAPAAYFRARRMRRALELLENPDLQITEIAYACGFANAAHFCTLFRKQHGVTPKRFRETLRK
jgi:LacI family transcriptional regulator